MATIVLVHGIAQEQKSVDTLEEEWLPNLAGGVRTAGFPEIADRLYRLRSGPDGIDTRMAFYGDLFLKGDQQGLEPKEPQARRARRLRPADLPRIRRPCSVISRPHRSDRT
jgi:hypothetical protein